MGMVCSCSADRKQGNSGLKEAEDGDSPRSVREGLVKIRNYEELLKIMNEKQMI